MAYPWLFIAMTGFIFLGVLLLTIFVLRRLLGSSKSTKVPEKDPIPRV